MLHLFNSIIHPLTQSCLLFSEALQNIKLKDGKKQSKVKTDLTQGKFLTRIFCRSNALLQLILLLLEAFEVRKEKNCLCIFTVHITFFMQEM